MGGYIAVTWGWDEQVQREFHTRAFNPDRWQIITLGGRDIGMIDVEYRPGEIYLARIEIHPDHQGSGIGSRLIGALVDEARKDGQDVVLDVLAINRRAARMLAGQAMSHVGRASGWEPAREVLKWVTRGRLGRRLAGCPQAGYSLAGHPVSGASWLAAAGGIPRRRGGFRRGLPGLRPMRTGMGGAAVNGA